MISLYQKYTRTINWFLGKVVDYDGQYANQCVDWIKVYARSLGYPVTTNGNAKDFATLGLGKGWGKVIGEPWVGDIVIFPSGEYGHIAVLQSIDGKFISVIDQNADGMAYNGNKIDRFGSPVSLNKYRIKGNEVYFRVNS